MDKNEQKALTPIEAVKFIMAQKGTKSFYPSYDVSNGPTAWRFGDMAVHMGYERALAEAVWIRDRVPGIPGTCTLLKTFADFLNTKTYIEDHGGFDS